MASVSFESFIKEHSIEIPAIQRDYVQGRGFTIEEQDKREAFVVKLINSIADDNAKPCHLEFIYGAVNKVSHSFIPLDGQQRLTSLFLLHWVVWQKSSEEAQKEYPLNLISGFKYETRLSSLSFCQNLIDKELLSVSEAKNLGSQLEKQPWFSENWSYDPTITTMLSMINFMEEMLQPYSIEKVSSMLQKLCNDKSVISFDELNMADYDLTDSLYIKMNARGKQLTPFENWKSDFIKYLEQEYGYEEYQKADQSRKSKSYTYKDYFCYSIEHQWTDLFWTYLRHEYLNLDEKQQQEQYPNIDKMFMNLFDFLCMYSFYVRNSSKCDYAEASAATKREIWKNREFIDFLFGALDSLCRIDHSIFFDNLFYICSEELPTANYERKVRLFRTKQTNLFKLCVENGSDMELTDLLLFHALLYYCDKNVVCAVDDSLKSYMRTVRNYYESDLQNLRSRTTVQLNLRVSEFGKYDSVIRSFADEDIQPLPVDDCIIEDCSIIHGNKEVFKEAIAKFGSEKVVRALSAFCKALQTDRIRVLIACGFNGMYLSDCIGRQRYFFGSKDKWDILFISDAAQLSKCFVRFTSKISEGKDIASIIDDAMNNAQMYGFAYYMLRYDDFINANNAQHHFAIRYDLNDVDWIALGSYSSNPGTAYHTDPYAVAVEKMVIAKNPNIKLSLYKQYSGKCPLSIVKDKINWEPLFSVISRKDGWHIIEGHEHLSEEITKDFGVQMINEQDFLVPMTIYGDMIQTCANLIGRVSNELQIQ